MTNSKPRVFFDSSVLFCAFCSKTGGSAKLFGLVKKGLIVGFTSQTAIEETEKNLEDFNEKDYYYFTYAYNCSFFYERL